MQNQLDEKAVHCPYCGEPISILIDTSYTEQNYIEDCEVCCRPITIKLRRDNDDSNHIELLQENEIG